MKRALGGLQLAVALAMAACSAATVAAAEPPAADDAWVSAMRAVHERFDGASGTLAQFGDSITVSLAYWAPLEHEARNASAEMETALARVRGWQRPECWREWRGGDYGNDGGQTIRWADQNLEAWLDRLRPEVAVVMFGTNDLGGLERDEYAAKTRSVVERCLARGTVVILSTIPPRHGYDDKAAEFAEAVREIAAELHVPLIDYHAEILSRRPDDWDGALEKFAEYQDYEVPTLIARDGVHPSYPRAYQSDYSDEGLSRSGYTLRSYLTLMKYAEVIKSVLAPDDSR